MTYRFSEGALRGQSFGNLLLAALNGITGSFEEAVAQMSQVLAISGTILPVTSADVQLEAVFENGSKIVGESQISTFKKEQDCFISHVNLTPSRPPATKSALSAIAAADLIVLGPGSLYTSIIPNLLVDGISEAICASPALTLYVCNIMTQEGETEGCTAADHIEALLTHGMPEMLDICLANSAPVRENILEKYQVEDATPLVVDEDRIRSLGIELVQCPVGCDDGDYARHDSDKLATAIYHIYQERAVRIFRGHHRYIIEEN